MVKALLIIQLLPIINKTSCKGAKFGGKGSGLLSSIY